MALILTSVSSSDLFKYTIVSSPKTTTPPTGDGTGMILFEPPSKSFIAHGTDVNSFCFTPISYVLMCTASFVSLYKTAIVGLGTPCKN